MPKTHSKNKNKKHLRLSGVLSKAASGGDLTGASLPGASLAGASAHAGGGGGAHASGGSHHRQTPGGSLLLNQGGTKEGELSRDRDELSRDLAALPGVRARRTSLSLGELDAGVAAAAAAGTTPMTRGGGSASAGSQGRQDQLRLALKRTVRAWVKLMRRSHTSESRLTSAFEVAANAQKAQEAAAERLATLRVAARRKSSGGNQTTGKSTRRAPPPADQGGGSAGKGAAPAEKWHFGRVSLPETGNARGQVAHVTVRSPENPKERKRVAVAVTKLSKVENVPEYTTWRTISRNMMCPTDQRRTVLYTNPTDGEVMIASDNETSSSSGSSDSEDGDDDDEVANPKSVSLSRILPPGATVMNAVGNVGRIVVHEGHANHTKLSHAAAASELLLARTWDSADDYVLINAATSFLPEAPSSSKKRRISKTEDDSPKPKDGSVLEATAAVREKMPLASSGSAQLDRGISEHRMLMREIMLALGIVLPQDEGDAASVTEAEVDAGFDRYAFALAVREEERSAAKKGKSPSKKRLGLPSENPKEMRRSGRTSSTATADMLAADDIGGDTSTADVIGSGVSESAQSSTAVLRSLFCSRCMAYNCKVHGVGQKMQHLKNVALGQAKRGKAPVAFVAPPSCPTCSTACFYGTKATAKLLDLDMTQMSAILRARTSLSMGGSGFWWSRRVAAHAAQNTVSAPEGQVASPSAISNPNSARGIAICSVARFVSSLLGSERAPTCATIGAFLKAEAGGSASLIMNKARAGSGSHQLSLTPARRRRGEADGATAAQGARMTARKAANPLGLPASDAEMSDGDGVEEAQAANVPARRRGAQFGAGKQQADAKARRRAVAWMRQQQMNAVTTKSVPSEYRPCTCESTCNPTTCKCAAAGNFCDQWCGCSPACALRFAGCRCRKSACGTRQCPCYAAGRECDPSICRCCPWESVEPIRFSQEQTKGKAGLPFWRPKAGEAAADEGVDGGVSNGGIVRSLRGYPVDVRKEIAEMLFEVVPADVSEVVEAAAVPTHQTTDVENKCLNMNLLLHRRRRVRLGLSDIAGWGAFLVDGALKGDYIGEYTGELVPHREADRRGKKYDREGLSFLFDLNDRWVLDARLKGNKLKFANHSVNANCRARVMLVRGDHRVGIYASEDMPPHTELFYDYRYDADNAPHWAGGTGLAGAGRPRAAGDASGTQSLPPPPPIAQG
ncbi:histone-lysine N-methyltransferase [Pycnococcus provasolii]